MNLGLNWIFIIEFYKLNSYYWIWIKLFKIYIYYLIQWTFKCKFTCYMYMNGVLSRAGLMMHAHINGGQTKVQRAYHLLRIRNWWPPTSFSFFERKHWLGLSTSNAVWIFWLDFIKARRTANNFLSQLFRDVTATWFIWWRTVDSTTVHVAFLSWIGSKLALD